MRARHATAGMAVRPPRKLSCGIDLRDDVDDARSARSEQMAVPKLGETSHIRDDLALEEACGGRHRRVYRRRVDHDLGAISWQSHRRSRR